MCLYIYTHTHNATLLILKGYHVLGMVANMMLGIGRRKGFLTDV